MKRTFVERTGKSKGLNIADEIESLLTDAAMLPSEKIPRSTMQRLFSSEGLRARAGISLTRGRFKLTHEIEEVLPGLARIASDLASREVVLGDLWKNEGKVAYLDKLDSQGVLPDPANVKSEAAVVKKESTTKPKSRAKPASRRFLILPTDHGIIWVPANQRHRDIWDELQFKLVLDNHPNAISVLLRVLIDLSTLHCQKSLDGLVFHANDKLSNRIRKAADALQQTKRLTANAANSVRTLATDDKLISTKTLNQYVHSESMTPAPTHLTAIWDTSREFVVACLNSHFSE